MPTHNNEKTALITGASRGLGLALARGLAQRGWNLIITAQDRLRLGAVRDELAAITHVAALAGDITDSLHQEQLGVLARGHAGLDAVMNNAGILGPSPQPPLLDYPLEMLVQVYLTNVVAQLGVIQAVKAELKPGARIVNVTSDTGMTAYSGWGGYGSSKAALEQLSAVLAVENPSLKVYWVDPGDMRAAPVLEYAAPVEKPWQTLTDDLAASEPPEARGLTRDGVRLMVSRAGGDLITHSRFRHLPDYLQRGDLVVVNTSATINASLDAWREETGEWIKLHLSTPVPGS